MILKEEVEINHFTDPLHVPRIITVYAYFAVMPGKGEHGRRLAVCIMYDVQRCHIAHPAPPINLTYYTPSNGRP